MIDQELIPSLMEDAGRAKDNLRARALVTQHLKMQNLPNVYLVDNLEDMLKVSVTLYTSNKVKEDIAKFSIKNKG